MIVAHLKLRMKYCAKNPFMNSNKEAIHGLGKSALLLIQNGLCQ